MSNLIMVTGGARSGKSNFAQSLLKDKREVAYIATSIPFDDEMKERVKKHREDRPEFWRTIECYKDFDICLKDSNEKHMILDCLTIMVTNLMLYYEKDWDNITVDRINEIENLITNEIKKLIKHIRSIDANMVMVTNELGMGIVPSNRLSRVFRDIAGRVNQLVARNCDEVYIVVSGIPLKIK